MKREDVRKRVEEIGIVPAVRVSSEHVARFAAEAVASGGIFRTIAPIRKPVSSCTEC